MTDETFLKRATEENSQPIDVGSPPLERCPACESQDIGSNIVSNHRRYYCRKCTTTWTPAIIAEILERDAIKTER